MLHRGDFRLSWNEAFGAVMAACGEQRGGGTWIIPEMLEAYLALHQQGHAHSLEVWDGAQLVGGVYGVQVGGLFAAESKFHRHRDMSKVALVALVRSLRRAGIGFVDVQFVTEHLRSLGASEVSLGRNHSVDGMPLLVAGTAGGKLRKGIHYREPSGDNALKVILTLMRAVGAPVASFGVDEALTTDSLAGLEA